MGVPIWRARNIVPLILSTGGIGYRIAYAFNDFDNRRMYALVVLILVVVSVVNAALLGWERRLRQRRGLT